MKPVIQQGFTLPEMLAAITVVGLAIGFVGSFASMRIDVEKVRAQQTESRYIASLVGRAHRQGLLADDAATVADLQAALPHLVIPTRLSGGQAYRIAVDGADPRLLIDTETNFHNGTAVARTEVVRAPFLVSELRIPFWRARQLRQLQEEAK